MVSISTSTHQNTKSALLFTFLFSVVRFKECFLLFGYEYELLDIELWWNRGKCIVLDIQMSV